MPRVSVIMPMYNAGAYVAEAVRSVLGQTFEDFEVIVIDDGSTDDSRKYVEGAARGDDRVQLVARENRGLVATLNEGIGRARGTLIARMDADDVSLPVRFEKQVAFLEEHQAVGVVGSWVERIGAENGVWVHPGDADAVVGALAFRNTLSHSAVMMRRSLFTEHGYAYDASALHAEDYALWMAVSRRTLLANLPEVLLRYRVHAKQVSTVHLQEQRRQTVALQLAFLHERLDVRATAEEEAIHGALAFSQLEGTEQFVRAAEAWLLRLAEANEGRERLPREGFLKALVGRFVNVRRTAKQAGLVGGREIPRLFQPFIRPGTLE